MSNLTLVVDNRTSIKHRVLKNLMENDGKQVSMFHAIRNIDDTQAAIDALKTLVADGLIERKEIGAWKHVFYRYKSELGFFRRIDAPKLA